MRDLLSRWPLMRQLTTGSNGTGHGVDERSDALASAASRRGGRHAIGVSVLRGWLRPADLSPQGTRGGRRRRPAVADLRGASVPQRGGHVRAAHPPGRATKVKYRAPHSTTWQDLDLETAMDMIADACLGVARAAFRRAKLRSDVDSDAVPVDRPSWWSDARQRRELSDQEAVRRRPRHGRDQQPGPDMT